jgi:hypothetical protein
MILTPPFYLSGEEGKTLGREGRLLSSLGITDAVLSLRSLDADRLQFSLRDNGTRPAIPDDGQWLTLTDDTGQVLFTGIARRSFAYPARVYSYEVTNVYQGMMETPLLGANGRASISYYSDRLENILADILIRAGQAGLPVAGPTSIPEMYDVPKMSFRSSSCGSALEDASKWLPDLATRMDYSTTPPSLRFYCRSSTPASTIDLDSDHHKTTALQLTALPEARALGLRFSYAVRSGDTTVTLATQEAGDPTAQGAAQQSIYLSGPDRLDAFLGEALVAALYAQAEVDKLIVAGGGTVVDKSPSVAYSWAACLALDTSGALAGAVAAEPGFAMVPSAGESFDTRSGWSQYDYGSTVQTGGGDPKTISSKALYLVSATGTILTGRYAAKSGFFTDEQLASIGVTREVAYIKGDLVKLHSTWTLTAGETYLITNAVTRRRIVFGSNDTTNRTWTKFAVILPVDALSLPPSIVQSLLAANNDGFNANLITRAGYADIPPDLAANYFARQDWTPYKGSLSLAPSVANIPMPGDFLNISGTGTPAEWATMAAPVAETEIDLRTGAPRITIGPSPRQDFRSLVDRLRIPAEDNYQAG